MKNLYILIILLLAFPILMVGQAQMEVEGKIKISDDTSSSSKGMIRWSDSAEDFEGYDGTDWLSLTRSESQGFSLTKFGTTKACENRIIDPTDGAGSTEFGYSTAMNSNYIVVGARLDDEVVFNGGAVYVYDLDGNNEQEIKPSGLTTNEQFGVDVGISDDWMIIGAEDDDEAATNSGSAYMYALSSGSWSFRFILKANDGAQDDFFGHAVDASIIIDPITRIERPFCVVGAYGNDDNGGTSGSAYVYWYDGITWSQEPKLLPSDGDSNDKFGFSLAMDGGRISIGAPGDEDNGANSGSVYLFSRNLSNLWNQTKLKPDDGDTGDQFGYSVDIDGNYMVIGAPTDDKVASTSGSAYVFYRNNGIWEQQAKIFACDAVSNEDFGKSVSISGDHIIIGAEDDDPNGNNSGSAYIFERIGTEWFQKNKLVPSDGADPFTFGNSVSIHGSTAVVGSKLHTVNGVASGAIYIF